MRMLFKGWKLWNRTTLIGLENETTLIGLANDIPYAEAVLVRSNLADEDYQCYYYERFKTIEEFWVQKGASECPMTRTPSQYIYLKKIPTPLCAQLKNKDGELFCASDNIKKIITNSENVLAWQEWKEKKNLYTLLTKNIAAARSDLYETLYDQPDGLFFEIHRNLSSKNVLVHLRDTCMLVFTAAAYTYFGIPFALMNLSVVLILFLPLYLISLPIAYLASSLSTGTTYTQEITKGLWRACCDRFKLSLTMLVIIPILGLNYIVLHSLSLPPTFIFSLLKPMVDVAHSHMRRKKYGKMREAYENLPPDLTAVVEKEKKISEITRCYESRSGLFHFQSNSSSRLLSVLKDPELSSEKKIKKIRDYVSLEKNKGKSLWGAAVATLSAA